MKSSYEKPHGAGTTPSHGYGAPTQKPEPKRCIGCGRLHPINPDGTPVGGALPCGH